MIRRHRSQLARIAHGTLRRCGAAAAEHEVDDLLQEVWCRMVQRFGPDLEFGGGDERLRRYLARTTRNVTVDDVRRRRAVKRGEGWRPVRSCVRDHRPLLVDRRETPEQRLLRREARCRILSHCARFIPAGQRRRDLAVFEMVFLDGLSSKEVASRVAGMSRRGVDGVVHRLRRRMDAGGFSLPLRR